MILTSMTAQDASGQSTHQMVWDDGSLKQIPCRTPRADSPYAGVGPRSESLNVDIGPGKYVSFWAYSPMTLYDPCPTDQIYPKMTTRDAVRNAVEAEILSRIRTGEIPLSSLKVKDAQ